jgi:rhodanese-related sulfurtransferase
VKQSLNRKESSGKKHPAANPKGNFCEVERRLLTIVLILVVAILVLTLYSTLGMMKALSTPPENNPVVPVVPGDLASAIEVFLDNSTDKTMKGSIALQSFKAGTAVILDVRTATLRQNGYISDSLHIPLKELMDRLDEVPKNKIIIIYCQNNINAAYATAVLNMQGFNAYVLENGIDSWIAAGGETTMLSPPPKTG